jgi:hypothetical protein
MAWRIERGQTMIKTQSIRRLMKSFRERLKPILSISGATIVLATFFINDSKREGMKDLGDSIESAENAYSIGLENRHTMAELQGLKDEFERFAAHPTSPIVFMEGGSSSFSAPDSLAIDSDAVDLMLTQQVASGDLLRNIGRLADRLPPDSRMRTRIARIGTMRDSCWKQWLNVNLNVGRAKKHPQGDGEEIQALNLKIEHLQMDVNSFADEVDGASSAILYDADTERQNAEHRYAIWTTIYRWLYGFGWVIATMGILMGGETPSPLDEMQG